MSRPLSNRICSSTTFLGITFNQLSPNVSPLSNDVQRLTRLGSVGTPEELVPRHQRFLFYISRSVRVDS